MTVRSSIHKINSFSLKLKPYLYKTFLRGGFVLFVNYILFIIIIIVQFNDYNNINTHI